jgi:hypothetical protein
MSDDFDARLWFVTTYSVEDFMVREYVVTLYRRSAIWIPSLEKFIIVLTLDRKKFQERYFILTDWDGFVDDVSYRSGFSFQCLTTSVCIVLKILLLLF